MEYTKCFKRVLKLVIALIIISPVNIYTQNINIGASSLFGYINSKSLNMTQLSPALKLSYDTYKYEVSINSGVNYATLKKSPVSVNSVCLTQIDRGNAGFVDGSQVNECSCNYKGFYTNFNYNYFFYRKSNQKISHRLGVGGYIGLSLIKERYTHTYSSNYRTFYGVQETEISGNINYLTPNIGGQVLYSLTLNHLFTANIAYRIAMYRPFDLNAPERNSVDTNSPFIGLSNQAKVSLTYAIKQKKNLFSGR